MSKKVWFFFIVISVFSSAPLLAADQVVLKEGKVLNGTIVDEAENEITLNLGSKMILHVDKTEIKTITRAPKPVSTRPTFTLDDLNKKAAKTPLPPPSPVNNVTEGAQTKEIKKEGAVLLETILTTGYGTTGALGLNAHPAAIHFDCRWEGAIGKEGAEFKWNSLVVRSTISVSMPRWDPVKTPDPEPVKAWNTLIEGVQKHSQGHIEIYSDTMNSIGEGLVSLRAKSEAELNSKSDQLVKDAMARAERKQRGYDRRQTTPALTTPKKKN